MRKSHKGVACGIPEAGNRGTLHKAYGVKIRVEIGRLQKHPEEGPHSANKREFIPEDAGARSGHLAGGPAVRVLRVCSQKLLS